MIKKDVKLETTDIVFPDLTATNEKVGKSKNGQQSCL